MDKEMEEWQKNNIFCSYIAESDFIYSILERIFEDIDECYEHGNHKFSADQIRDFIHDEFLDEIQCDLEDWILDDSYLTEEGEEDG